MNDPHSNPAFLGDDGAAQVATSNSEEPQATQSTAKSKKPVEERPQWGKGIEFLMSCIAMSVGLGNVWRFPFTALENGGGAFLIPYLVVLFLVGKPIYYLEMIIGQFSSRGSVKVFDLCPAMRGVGVGQIVMVFLLGTYYESICATIAFYLVQSFRNPLPWSYCRPEWGENCIPSGTAEARNWALTHALGILPHATEIRGDGLLMIGDNFKNVMGPLNSTETSVADILVRDTSGRIQSSSELYFINEVLREKDNINDGIGVPNWELVIGLLVSWVCVFLIIRRGVKSSGKASYFLALFPYLIMGILLVRAVTLPGAANGILYFIRPDWSKILDPKVWYAAVTQCFYSLSVCFGNIIMYSSYNKFDHNVYRDSTIVTALDTCTSLLAGFTIFGILGHLAHEIGTDDIGTVVKGGTGLAFISYPDAIAKFQVVPQIFSVLFFLMLFVLGIGSNIAMTSCTVTAITDSFPKVKQWHCALAISIVSYIVGLAYITPGGQFILTLVDYHGASMIALVLGIAELYVLGWIYGTDRLCKDAEFMMGRKVGIYFRLCWSIFTPLIMTLILIYFLVTYTPLTYNGITYPSWAYAIGWTITAFGVVQLPIWAAVAIIRQPGDTFGEKFRGAFKPKADWGPTDPQLREQYNKEIYNEQFITERAGFCAAIKRNIFG